MKGIPAIHPVITKNTENVLVKRAPQRLIIGKPIRQYTSYSAIFCPLYSNISKEQHEKHLYTDERKEYGAEDRYSLEPQKAHLTGEFVIVEKFGGHALRHLASTLANVIRQGGRQTKNLV